MKSQASDKNERLFEVAEAQQGFFTAKQAIEAGFIQTNHSYHVRAGNWVREGRGVYRLRNFPQSPESQLVAHALWTRNRQDVPEGIYSHETALSIHDLSDVMPAKLHMTVPPSFRRFAQPPKILKLHFSDLDPKDVEQRRGFKVTRPMKAILDLMTSESVSPEIIEKAFIDGIHRGLIPLKDVLSDKTPTEIRAQFDKWLKQMPRVGSKEAG